MTHQLAGRTTPITGAIDQGVHNYVVHMRPLAGAWLDPTGRIAAALRSVPDDAVEIADEARTDRRHSSAGTVALGRQREGGAIRHDLAALSPGRHLAAAGSRSAVRRARRGGRLLPASARRRLARRCSWAACVASAMRSMCIASATSTRMTRLSWRASDARAHVVPATDAGDCRQRRAFLSEPGARPDRVRRPRRSWIRCWCSTTCARSFPRDPFLTKTIGLSAFCEGPTRIGESDYNRDRLGLFVPLDEGWLRQSRRVVDGAAWDAAARCVSSTAGCSSNWSAARSC